MTVLTPDLAVIGAGSGGLSVAAGAVQMGASVVLIERGRMGGDCLNYGCVPSKSLLAAAHAAHTVRTAGRFGVNGHEPEVDFLKVREHVRGVIAGIAPHDSVERFEGLGVTVVKAQARFTGDLAIEAGGVHPPAPRRAGHRLPRRPSRRCPGSTRSLSHQRDDLRPRRAAGAPPRPRRRPDRLRARPGPPPPRHARDRLEMGSILPKDDPEAVEVVRRRSLAEGVDLRENVEVTRVERRGNRLAVVVAGTATAAESVVEASHLLVAAGRRPKSRVSTSRPPASPTAPRASRPTRRLRTTNPKVWAVGDVAGRWQFTHIAGYHAGIVIRQALFRLPAKVDDRAVPWATYTDPELAQVGLTARRRPRRRPRGEGPHLPVRRERPRAGRAGDRGLRQGPGRRQGPRPRRHDRGRRAGELIQLWGLASSRSGSRSARSPR